jgi:hypothetical protein
MDKLADRVSPKSIQWALVDWPTAPLQIANVIHSQFYDGTIVGSVTPWRSKLVEGWGRFPTVPPAPVRHVASGEWPLPGVQQPAAVEGMPTSWGPGCLSSRVRRLIFLWTRSGTTSIKANPTCGPVGSESGRAVTVR